MVRCGAELALQRAQGRATVKSRGPMCSADQVSSSHAFAPAHVLSLHEARHAHAEGSAADSTDARLPELCCRAARTASGAPETVMFGLKRFMGTVGAPRSCRRALRSCRDSCMQLGRQTQGPQRASLCWRKG